jgi:hypothetical protein
MQLDRRSGDSESLRVMAQFNGASLDSAMPSGPGKATLTAEGHPRTIFRRALERDT